MPDTDEAKATPAEPQGEDVKAQPSQDTTDWKAEARKWEKRAKENSDAVNELAKLKETLQAAASETDTLKTELDTLKAEKVRTDLIQATAAAVDVDSALLARMSGETADEIEANAQALKEVMNAQRKYPDVSDKGDGREVGEGSTADQFANALEQVISN